MTYKKISMETWKRAGIFKHFMEDVRCVVTVTAEVDISGLPAYLKREGLRFYPLFLYAVAKTVNLRDEFKMGYGENGELLLYDSVSPSHVVFHPEDELFTRLVTDYSADRSVFCARVLSDMEKYKDRRGHEIAYPQKNTFDVSCLPWLHYLSLDLHIFDSGTYLAPVITWGRFKTAGEKTVLPLTLQIHHAVADGFHISMFYEELEAEIRRIVSG